MAIDKFTFISPGIFISEIDESQNPIAPDVMGPCIIGRTLKGPAMRPIKVKSYDEFVSIFGEPHPGGVVGDDGWRSATPTGPTYASYAAKAWLNAGSAPATVVRLLEEDNDVASSTTSGWTTTRDPQNEWKEMGGALGLWVIDSGNFDAHNTGTLAATFYVQSGSMLLLSGATRDFRSDGISDNTHVYSTGAAGALIQSKGTNENLFHLQLWHENALAYDFGNVNFTAGDPRWIRNVANTDPSLAWESTDDIVTTANFTKGENRYWLGETYERNLAEYTNTSGPKWGMILPLMSGSDMGMHDRQNKWVNAQTSWFLSQDMGSATSYDPPNTCQKLFKLHALDYGSWANRNLKIGIEDIRAGTTATSPWGSFTVAVYPAHTYDTNTNEEALEKFSGCNLDENSPNYIAKVIGTQYVEWSDANKMLTEKGEGGYVNKSKYIRVELNRDRTSEPALLPFGCTGPLRSVGFSYISNSGSSLDTLHASTSTSGSRFLLPYVGNRAETPSNTIMQQLSDDNIPTSGFVTSSVGGHPGHIIARTDATYGQLQVTSSGDGGGTAAAVAGSGSAIHVGTAGYISGGFSGSWLFPAPGMRSSSTDGGTDLGDSAYFGLSTTRSRTSTTYDAGYGDYNTGLPFGTVLPGRFDNTTVSGLPSSNVEFSWVFSLDDISGSNSDGSSPFIHISGSRKGESSVSAVGTSTYKDILSKGVRQFFAPMYGGHDGFDVKEREPFRNSAWTDGSTTNLSDSAYNTIERAILTVEDPEAVEYNILTVPGITLPSLTSKMIDTCQTRADSLAIIDLDGVFIAETENASAYSDRLGSVTDTVSKIQARDLNSSYACAYYPWVQISDAKSGGTVYVPPSVVALGTFASNDASSELWFAPAGFNRGGLTAGSSGLTVTNVTERVTSKKRDDLYENNINPIAKFPAEGIVIFGQKTLQQTSSALDRINVRRLLIYVKKEISRMAATVLFDQNVDVTWSRFSGQVEPFLSDIRARYGLTDFQVILDETTTTDDLIDRNIMYAKIFLKPARAIEYIAIDFVVTSTGASFED
jgi:hypothetical protein